MQLLLLKLHQSNDQIEYAQVSAKQKTSSFKQADWEQIPDLASGNKVVVFIPNEDVLLTHVKIPSKSKKQLIQAVPFALEERLAEDIETLHFAVHREEENSEAKVAVISHVHMEKWLSLLSEHRIQPHYVLPSLFSLPYQATTWTIISGQDKSHLRTSKWTGFSCATDLLAMFVEDELQKQTPEKILFSGDDAQLEGALGELDKTSLINPNEVNHDDIVEVLDFSLLHNYSRGDSPLFNFDWKPWVPAASLAAALGVIWIGSLVWQNHQLDNKLNRTEAEIESVYKKTFPGSRIQNAAVQMKQKLTELQKANGSAGGSPLHAIAAVSPFFKKFPDIALREIRQQNKEVLLVISAPNISRLENFKNALIKETALNIDIKSSTTTSDKVESTLAIKGLV